MTKVVICARHGGFGVSLAAGRRLAELGHDDAAKRVREYDEAVEEFKRTGVNPQWSWTRTPTELSKRHPDWHGSLDCRRDDPALVQTVQELGDAASDKYADLRIVELPDDVSWHIEEYDGLEWVAEDHRKWFADA